MSQNWNKKLIFCYDGRWSPWEVFQHELHFEKAIEKDPPGCYAEDWCFESVLQSLSRLWFFFVPNPSSAYYSLWHGGSTIERPYCISDYCVKYQFPNYTKTKLSISISDCWRIHVVWRAANTQSKTSEVWSCSTERGIEGSDCVAFCDSANRYGAWACYWGGGRCETGRPPRLSACSRPAQREWQKSTFLRRDAIEHIWPCAIDS